MTTKLIQSNFLTLGILTVISISSLSFSASHAFANPGDSLSNLSVLRLQMVAVRSVIPLKPLRFSNLVAGAS
jgi:hypothetical protein